MKRFFTILLLAIVLCPFGSYAQKAKFGHINADEVMQALPGIDSVEKVVREMQAELQATGEAMADEFTKKQAEYEALGSKGVSAAVIKIKEEELANMYQRIEEFKVTAQQDLQEKYQELLKPFHDKVLEAIKEVATENNFTYIFDTSILTYYDQGEDISAKVKTKLGIK